MKKLFISAIVIALLSLVVTSCKSEAERIKEFNQEYERKRNEELKEELKKEKEESLWILEQIHIVDNKYQPLSEQRRAIIRLEMKYPDAFKEYSSEWEKFENINYIKCKIDSIRRYN